MKESILKDQTDQVNFTQLLTLLAVPHHTRPDQTKHREISLLIIFTTNHFPQAKEMTNPLSSSLFNTAQPHAEAHTKSHIHTDTHPLTHTAQGNVISMILLNPLLFWDN